MRIARFATAAALVLAMAACHDRSRGEVRDAGPATDRDYTVGAFQKIAVSGGYDVTVTAGGASGVHARGGQAVLDETEILVENGTLKIQPRRKSGFHLGWGNHGKVTVTVSGAGALTGAAIAGSGDLRIDRAGGPGFKGEVAGSGNLGIDALDAREVELSIAGSGDIRAAGKAAKVNLNIAGSGDIDAPGLIATDASVSIAGSGNVTAHATGQADISMLGSGDVTITGGAHCNVTKNGSGNAHCS
ncbi:MAG: head GIN domain-containing protein [Sphingomicrobium sp.]